MALILNIETSTEVCSVSLAESGNLVVMKESNEGFNHSKLLTVFIDEIFKENSLKIKSLDAVAVSKGPGSYTGLRIGVSVAKGLCYGLNIPLISVCSLEMMAVHTARNLEKYVPASNSLSYLFCPMIDARRMEVYTALYNTHGKEIRPVSAEIIEENFLSELLDKNQILFFGNGAEKCKARIIHKNALFAGPFETSAQFMQAISEIKYKNQEFEDVAYFEPFYLKNFVVTIPKDKILK
ncbi:MAG: tRNA (adenosine(37)-N6)-threonylcarbamoyltransferase complex dimerization subunit type 1 TsaB [Bacteroidetes bacterium]|nr:MAG: tRNA (adenosine(37)-N6)-threonylcarbamoyltransferase complex dimerization subunit type 1 TsaB [Bacteroidota bacterium]